MPAVSSATASCSQTTLITSFSCVRRCDRWPTVKRTFWTNQNAVTARTAVQRTFWTNQNAVIVRSAVQRTLWTNQNAVIVRSAVQRTFWTNQIALFTRPFNASIACSKHRRH